MSYGGASGGPQLRPLPMAEAGAAATYDTRRVRQGVTGNGLDCRRGLHYSGDTQAATADQY